MTIGDSGDKLSVDPAGAPALDSQRAAVTKMVVAASDLVDSFTPAQRVDALFDRLDDAAHAERVRWFYTPTDHGGVPLRTMSPRQQSLVMQLLATGLTRPAYVTACSIIGLENVLDEFEGWHVNWGRERGRDPGLYWVRIFGCPGDPVWGWRIGGHHVSVNLLLRDGLVASATPSFLGADPARSPILGGYQRPLGPTEDLARTLLHSLDRDQHEQAVLHRRAISDIVSGNRPIPRPGDTMMHMQDLFRGPLPTPELAAAVERIDEVAEAGSGYTDADHARMALGDTPSGLSAGEMSAVQRDVLRRLVAAFTDRSPAPVADGLRKRYLDDGHLDELGFGWAGSSKVGAPHYFRVTGPRLLVEYDNTQREANHAHSVWRDPLGDFGLDPYSAHRTAG